MRPWILLLSCLSLAGCEHPPEAERDAQRSGGAEAQDSGGAAGPDPDADSDAESDADAGADSDADTGADADTDVDGDGVSAALDCDDDDPSRSPDAAEVCDGEDNDCDGLLDGVLGCPLRFSTCGAVGASGPGAADCAVHYAGTPLALELDVTAGVQRWTVPVEGDYTIEAWGAEGAAAGAGLTGGAGAYASGTVRLLAGEVLLVVVGQRGLGASSGANGGGGGGGYTGGEGGYLAGGGGSFVDSGATDVVLTSGLRLGDGDVTFVLR